jgi:hypothetical protein
MADRLASRLRVRRWACAAAVLAASCVSPTSATSASVEFLIDAPLCSSLIPASFYVDGALVASDTMIVGLGARNHASRQFQVAPGTHTLHATSPWSVDWPDKTVTLIAGQTAVDSLPVYCS